MILLKLAVDLWLQLPLKQPILVQGTANRPMINKIQSHKPGKHKPIMHIKSIADDANQRQNNACTPTDHHNLMDCVPRTVQDMM